MKRGSGVQSRVTTREPPTQTGRRSVLLYDAGCAFCRWAVAQVLRWDRAVRLRPLGIQSEEGERLLAVLDRNDVVHALDRIKRRQVIRLVE